jgi:hypothetical protein
MGPEVVNGSLTGADLASCSINGQQVAEHTLGEVPNATIAGHGGYGRQSGGGETGESCTLTDEFWFTCGSVAMNPSAQARFVVTGRFQVSRDDIDDAYASAECRLSSSLYGASGIPGTLVGLHVEGDDSDWVTITGITGVHPPGNHSFGLDCRLPSSIPPDGTRNHTKISGARVTAIAISPF